MLWPYLLIWFYQVLLIIPFYLIIYLKISFSPTPASLLPINHLICLLLLQMGNHFYFHLLLLISSFCFIVFIILNYFCLFVFGRFFFVGVELVIYLGYSLSLRNRILTAQRTLISSKIFQQFNFASSFPGHPSLRNTFAVA